MSYIYITLLIGEYPNGYTEQYIYLAFEYNISNEKVTNWYNVDPNTCVAIQSPTLEILFNSSDVVYDGSNLTGKVTFENNPNMIGVLPPYYHIFIDFSESVFIIVDDNNTPIFTNNFDLTSGSCCFNEGTKILCYTQLENSLICILKEEYRLVQHLKIGDLVKSYLHGYRKVSKIIKGKFVNNPKDEGVSNCMYRMIRTKDNGLIEDLTLTRNHGVLVEKLSKQEEKKINKNNLTVIDNLLSIITADCDKFEKVMDTNTYKYYHFSLDGDGDNDRRFGVYANGLLVEIPSNNMLDGALNTKPLDF
jgi:hypothetical protein